MNLGSCKYPGDGQAVTMDHTASSEKCWNYGSNEIVNSNSFTGSLKTLFNELDSSKEKIL